MSDQEFSDSDVQPGAKNATWIVIVCVACVVAWMLFSDDENVSVSNSIPLSPIVPTPTGDEGDEGEDLNNSQATASMTVLDLKIKQVDRKSEEQIKNLIGSVEALKSQLDSMERANNVKLRGIVDQFRDATAKSVEDSYAAINASGSVGDDFDVLGDMSLSDAVDDKSKPAGTTAETGDTAITETNPYGAGYIMVDHSAFIDSNSGDSIVSDTNIDLGGVDLTRPIDSAKASAQYAVNKTGEAISRFTGNDHTGIDVDPSQPVQHVKEKITVPAASFVEVTLLHGVACPIGGSLSEGGGELPGRPVVLPVHGIFKGPNGFEVDLGTAHLMGLCGGRRTSDPDVGRAEISISLLSYWDETGGPQTESAPGYIIDSRDNQLDVAGQIDKASTANLGKEAFAASMAALASTLSQSEFSQVSGIQGTQQFLTGSNINAAGAEGIAGLFQRIAEQYEMEANSTRDTVLVPPGIPLRFYLEKEISVVKGADLIEMNYATFYDVAI